MALPMAVVIAVMDGATGAAYIGLTRTHPAQVQPRRTWLLVALLVLLAVAAGLAVVFVDI